MWFALYRCRHRLARNAVERGCRALYKTFAHIAISKRVPSWGIQPIQVIDLGLFSAVRNVLIGGPAERKAIESAGTTAQLKATAGRQGAIIDCWELALTVSVGSPYSKHVFVCLFFFTDSFVVAGTDFVVVLASKLIDVMCSGSVRCISVNVVPCLGGPGPIEERLLRELGESSALKNLSLFEKHSPYPSQTSVTLALFCLRTHKLDRSPISWMATC